MKVATTTLVGCVGALLALGLVMLYSSSIGPRGGQFITLQLQWGGVGLLICLVLALTDYRRLRSWWWVLLALAVVLLALVWAPGIGRRINGARRWIGWAGYRFQPSELAKLALLVALANYGERYQRQMPQFIRGLLVPGLLIGTMLALIFLEPDWGTTFLLALVSTSILLLAGVRWRYFVPLVLAGIGSIVVLLLHNPVRWTRILAWFHPEAHKEGVGYQACQAMVALGSGGGWGLGLGNGRQKLGFVPEHHTDFILAVIGEELGLIATLAVLLAFVLLVFCGAYIARKAREPFGFLLGSGLTLMIGSQAFINIGVVTSLLPNKGLPLPFISYGGSNLVLMLACVGLLISIARQAGEEAFEEEAILAQPAVASLPY